MLLKGNDEREEQLYYPCVKVFMSLLDKLNGASYVFVLLLNVKLNTNKFLLKIYLVQ